jgi:pimeloyl-ACP methyl ester carboxylesterase
VAAVTLAAPVHATNSDVAKEKRWAEQVIDSLLDGDELWLDDGGGHEFLGILTEGDASSGRAVILVHGIGVHPNWPDVIFPLREALLENDITSLSMEVPGRLQAAVDFLKDSGYSKIDIVGHSMGARMATYYLAQASTDGVNSAVFIGLGNSSSGSWPESIDALARLRVPVLDLYGGKDLDIVLNTVQDRANSGQKNESGVYRQTRVEQANHFFQGHEDELKGIVIGWLDQH